MKHPFISALLAVLMGGFFVCGATIPVRAQSNSVVILPGGCGTGNFPQNSGYLTIDSTGHLCTSGSGGSSASQFVPSGNYATLTATGSSSASTALPTNTGTVAFQNQTSVAVSCTLASGSATATANELIVPAGSTIFVGTTGYSNAACINQTGSASNVIVMAGGAGPGAGFGGGGSSGSGLVQTSPPSYTNGTNQPLTLNQQGALPAASLNLGSSTCSVNCNTTGQTLLSTNTFGYTTFSAQVTAEDGSLLEVDVSYNNGTTWSQLPLETYNSQGGTSGNGQFNSFIISGIGVGTAACARIPNPGGLLRVYFTNWGNGTLSLNSTLSNSDSCARPTTVSNGSVNILTQNGNELTRVDTGVTSQNSLIVNAGAFSWGRVKAVNETSTAGFLILVDAATVPATGSLATSTIIDCQTLPASGTAEISYSPGPWPASVSNGLVALLSSGANCHTYTTGTITGFIQSFKQ